jgi:hypothetical protein
VRRALRDRRGGAALVGGLGLLATALGAVAPSGAGAVRAVEVGREANIREITRSYGGLVFDLDGDGWQDLLIGRHWAGPMRLHHNRGDGTFRNVWSRRVPRGERGIRDPHGCASADVNGDGRQDLFCTTGGVRGTAPNPNVLWIQGPDGKLRKRTHAYRVGNRWGRGRAATFVHANGDRWPDLFVGNHFPREDGRRSANRLYINVQGRRFRHAPGFGVDRELGAESVQAADYDRDGREDLILCGKSKLHIYRNVAHRRYRDMRGALGVRGRCTHALVARMDRRAGLDLVLVKEGGISVRLYRRGRFRRAYQLRRDGGVAAAVGDVDGDRRPDIYFLRQGRRNHDARDHVLLNRKGGHRFRSIHIPQSRRGVGESVQTIDYDRNGLDDFVVENGFLKARGPVRLIAFR